jgi:hypothetical protein
MTGIENYHEFVAQIGFSQCLERSKGILPLLCFSRFMFRIWMVTEKVF